MPAVLTVGLACQTTFYSLQWICLALQRRSAMQASMVLVAFLEPRFKFEVLW